MRYFIKELLKKIKYEPTKSRKVPDVDMKSAITIYLRHQDFTWSEISEIWNVHHTSVINLFSRVKDLPDLHQKRIGFMIDRISDKMKSEKIDKYFYTEQINAIFDNNKILTKTLYKMKINEDLFIEVTTSLIQLLLEKNTDDEVILKAIMEGVFKAKNDNSPEDVVYFDDLIAKAILYHQNQDEVQDELLFSKAILSKSSSKDEAIKSVESNHVKIHGDLTLLDSYYIRKRMEQAENEIEKVLHD